MKRTILLILASAVLFASCTKKKEKAFDENLQRTYLCMEIVVTTSAIISDEIADTWRTAIWDNKDRNGKYCKDFNVALAQLATELSISGVTDSIKQRKVDMENYTNLMKNPPSSRKECYEDLVDLISEAGAFSRFATNPVGSLNSYNEERHEAYDRLNKKRDMFRIKYGDFMKDLKDLRELY